LGCHRDRGGFHACSYDAWGNPLVPNPGDPFGYDAQWGYYTDNETGLLLLTHRYYDPTQGRFLTRDPIGYSGGVNLYGYVGNEVIYGADPFGEYVLDIGIGAIGQFMFAGWGDAYLEIQPVGGGLMNWKVGLAADIGGGGGYGAGYGVGLEFGVSPGEIKNTYGQLSLTSGGFCGDYFIGGGSISYPEGPYPRRIEGATFGLGKFGVGEGGGFYLNNEQRSFSMRLGTIGQLWQKFNKWMHEHI
jgi:RHS repeat-associated protein